MTQPVEKAHVPHEVAALLAAFHLSSPNLAPLQQLREDQWHALLEFCHISNLTLPLAQLPLQGFPLWVQERLQRNLADNALRFESIASTYREVKAALDSAEVDHVVIKGFTQAPHYVANPKLRSQSDLDLYCPPEKIALAQKALEGIGFLSEKTINFTADHDHSMVRNGNWEWRGNPFDPEMPLGVELHFCLWNQKISRLDLPEVDEFWSRRTTRHEEGLSFRCLHPVDHMGYLTLHILRNLFLRDWIMALLRELAVFLHTHADDDTFWDTWSQLHSPSLRSLETIAFFHARAWFGCRLSPQVEQQIAALPASRHSWLERFSNSALENMFRQNKDILWLQLSLISSTRDRWDVFKRTMVPRVATIDSPTVRFRNKRAHPSSNPLVRYASYLFFRSKSHVGASLSTLSHGLSWWISQHQLPASYWFFLGTSFFFTVGLSIFYFLFNLFLLGHGYTEKNIGLITSAMAIGNLVATLPASQLARRLGLRTLLLSCFTAITVICAVRVMVLAFPLQLILAFFAGLTLSFWAVCLSPAIAQLTNEKQRPLAFSLLFSSGIGCGAIAGLIGGRLPGYFIHHGLHIGHLEPQQIVLLLSCVITALGLFPALKFKFKPLPEPTQRNRIAINSPFLRRYLPAIAMWSLVTGSFSPLASVYLANHIHLNLQQIGDAFSFSQAAQVAAVLLAPLLFRKWGLIHGILFTQVAAAAMLFVLSSTLGPLSAISAYICFSSFQWMNEPGLYSLLMNSVPEEDRTSASAANSFVISSSGAIAAAIFGTAFVRYGYPMMIRIIALIALLSAILFANLQKSQGTQTEPLSLPEEFDKHSAA